MGTDALEKMDGKQKDLVAKLRLLIGRCNETLAEAAALAIEVEIDIIDVTSAGDPVRVSRITAAARQESTVLWRKRLAP